MENRMISYSLCLKVLRILPILLIFIIFASLAEVSFGIDDPVVEAIQYRIKGYVYQRQGDFSQAMECYKKAIDRYPFYACAHNDLGVLYEQKGQLEKAEKEYLKAIEIEPGYAKVYTNLALLYEGMGKIEAACYYWQKRSELGSAGDVWTINAKKKFAELSAKLAEQQKVKQAEYLKSVSAKKPAREAAKKPVRKRPAKEPVKPIEEPVKSTKESVKPVEEPVKKSASKPQAKKTEAIKKISYKKPEAKPVETAEAFETYEAYDLAERLSYEKNIERKQKIEEAKKQEKLKVICQRYLECANKYMAKQKYDSAIRQYEKIKKTDPNYPYIDQLIQEAQAAQFDENKRLREKVDQRRREKEEAKLQRRRLAEEERLEKYQKKLTKVLKSQEKELDEQDKIGRPGAVGAGAPIKESKPEKDKTQQNVQVEKQSKGYQEKMAKREQERSLKKKLVAEEAVRRSEKIRLGDVKGQKEQEPVPQDETLTKIKAQVQAEQTKKEQKRLEEKINRHIEKCKKYLASGKARLAISEYKKIQKLDPNRAVDVDIDKLMQLNEQAETQKAAVKHFKKGQKLYYAGKYEDAIRELKTALDLNPNNYEAYRMLRYCQRRAHVGYYSLQDQEPMASAAVAQQQEEVYPSTTELPPVTKALPAEVEKKVLQELERQNNEALASETVDIEKKYQIIGAVAYRAESGDISTLNKELLKKAKAMGAEEVVQVKYFQHNNYIYGYGTAVKRKK